MPLEGSGTNVDVAPIFAGRATGDYHLTEADPALIDAGDPSLVTAGETDLAGNPRVIEGNCEGIAAPDLGAYELIRTAPCPPTGGGGAGGGAYGVGGGGGSAASPGTGKPGSGGGKGGGGSKKKPKLTAISVKGSKAGPVLHFTLDEPAKVKITVERIVTRVVRGHRKKVAKAVGTLTDVAKKAGAQSIPLAAKIGAAKLISRRLRGGAIGDRGRRLPRRTTAPGSRSRPAHH